MYKDNFLSVIIAAGGNGKRMGLNVKKQFLEIDGKEILHRTIEKFNDVPEIDEIIIVAPQDDCDYCRENIVNKFRLSKVKKIVPGGGERYISVKKGLDALSGECGIVLIHDGVRPFVKRRHILYTVDAAIEKGAAILAARAKETIKLSKGDYVENTIDRSKLWYAQTPQTFRKEIITKAYEEAEKDGFTGTDDASLVERLGQKVYICEGDYSNIKITNKEDLLLGEALIKAVDDENS